MVHALSRLSGARNYDCDRFNRGELEVLLTLIEACEGVVIGLEYRERLSRAKGKLEEQKRLLG